MHCCKRVLNATCNTSGELFTMLCGGGVVGADIFGISLSNVRWPTCMIEITDAFPHSLLLTLLHRFGSGANGWRS